MGLGLVVVATVAGAAIVFGGVLGGPSPTATPRTVVGSASQAPPTPRGTVEVTGRPTARPARRPTEAPTERATSGPTDEPPTFPTGEPTQAASPSPGGDPLPTVGGPAPPPTGTFECDRSSALQDPLSQGWRIQAVDWRDEGDHDRLTVTLNRFGPLAGEATQAIVHVLPVDDVADTLKVVAPSAGRDAVALGLWQGVRLTWTLDQELSLAKVRWVTLGKDDHGFAWLVLGVRGRACYSLQAPDWSTEDPETVPTTQVVVDVEH